jgi:SAM-dependent methyltransferase
LLARAYPQASVFHDRSIQVARQQAGHAGLGGRIRFEALDATSYPADGFDLICLLDTLHDLGDPAAALVHARKALAPDGAVLVVEPNAADDYAANLAGPLAPQAWAGGLAAALLIGALAGLLPAIRATRLSPTQALWTL